MRKNGKTLLAFKEFTSLSLLDTCFHELKVFCVSSVLDGARSAAPRPADLEEPQSPGQVPPVFTCWYMLQLVWLVPETMLADSVNHCSAMLCIFAA